MATQETIDTCRHYLTGYASAVKQMLWDRNGSDAGWETKGHPRPQYYWCPSVRIGGKQHGVVGPNGYIGQYSRKDAIAEAEGFLRKCREILSDIDA